MKPELTLKQHLTNISKARWEKASKEEKSQHGKMMNAKRWADRVSDKNIQSDKPATSKITRNTP